MQIYNDFDIDRKGIIKESKDKFNEFKSEYETSIRPYTAIQGHYQKVKDKEDEIKYGVVNEMIT